LGSEWANNHEETNVKTQFVLLNLAALLLIGCLSSPAQGQHKRSRFEVTVDSLISEVDVQLEDRGKLIKLVGKLYEDLKQNEVESLDLQVERARLSAVQREALITADRMALDPESKARASEIIDFLDRLLTRDQQIYDQYVTSKESVRFEYERQLAKIKSEQTVLKSIRKDLENLKKLPRDKEQAQFFLGSVKTLLDGLKNAHQTIFK
jgi:hypothetical protein